MNIRNARSVWILVLAAVTGCFLTVQCSRRVSAETSGEVWTGHTGGVSGVAYLSGGDKAVSCGLDGAIKLWNVLSGRPIRDLSSGNGEIFALSADPAGRVIAASGYDGKIRIVGLKGGSAWVLSGYRGWSADVALSPDSRRVAAWSMDGGIWIFDADSGNRVQTIKGQPNKWGLALAWSPDGKILAAARAAISLWDIESGKVIKTLDGHQDFVRALAFSPEGRRLASASMDKSIRVWDLDAGKEAFVLKPEGFVFYADSGPITAPIGLPATAVAFSPDGKTLATGGADRVVRLWDARTGSLKKELKGHRNAVTAVAFSPDGSRLISSALDHTIRSWRVD